MHETEIRSAPRVSAAIAAVKATLAEQYRAVSSAFPDAAARAHWQESHGALCIVGDRALIRLSAEIGALLEYAAKNPSEPAQVADAINQASSTILAYMDDPSCNTAGRASVLVATYRALVRARGVESIAENDVLEALGIRDDSAVTGTLDTFDSLASSHLSISDDVASGLKTLNEAWCGWAAGEMQADVLRARIETLDGAACTLDGSAAANLIAAIGSAMRAQCSQAQADPDAIVEISSALLMLQDLIEDASRAAPTFARRSSNACARLKACEKSDRLALKNLAPMELLDAQARSDEARVVLLAEADTVITYVESVLKEFFADAGTRNALVLLDKPLAQCAGTFAMLQDDSAAAVVSLCRAEIAQLARDSNADATLKDRLARRLTALTEYVEASRQGHASLEALLAQAGLETPTTVSAISAPPSSNANVSAHTAGESEALDQDMLEVFLEEAVEVLSTVATTLPLSEQNPNNSEHLTTLRRAFHTLKGSGRMVGLTDLGEAAWEIEQVFNKLAQDRLAGSPDLYRLVTLAHTRFAQWISDLRAHGRAVVDAAQLTVWARQVRNGDPLDVQAEPPKSLGATAPTSADNPGLVPVQVGETRISPILYGIFIEEAREHIDALNAYAKRIANEPNVVTQADFLRAAHTLCGISATVGFASLSDLASSLERTLLHIEKTGDALDSTSRHELVRAVERLAGMLARIEDGQAPPPEPALIEALNQIVRTKREPNVRAPSAVAAHTTASVTANTNSGERRTTRLDDDIDHELLTVFLAEAEELLPQVDQGLREWRERANDKLAPQSLQRLLHTLKGSARMAGAMAVGELTHRMETRVENGARLISVPESLFDELDSSFDRLNELIGALQNLERVPRGDSQQLAPTTLTGDFPPVTLTTVTQPVVMVTLPTPPSAPAHGATGPIERATDPKIPAAVQSTAAAPRTMLRVRTDSAERLANQAGEVAIARARAEAELRAARAVMRELADNIMRLRGQLREIELQAEMQMQSRVAQTEESDARFDPLEFDRFTRLQELTRLMAESVNDLSTVQQNLVRNLDESESALGAQARTTRELQDDLVRIRMAPFSSLSDRLFRVARVAARDVGKRVQLDIRGGHAELDRGILDRIVAPLEHLLRNSIAHGIEAETQRKAAGKPELGEIVIDVRQEGNEVVVAISDDGAGLDIERIRAQAITKGLMRVDEHLTDAQIADFIFRPGFSTAESVSEIAGRGVGLDVVRNEISSLGGRIQVDFEPGKGTRLTMYLSLTLAVLKAVVIRAGDELYALPSLLVEQLQSLKADALSAAYRTREIVWRDGRYDVHYLPHLLGRTKTSPSPQKYNPVLLLRSGAHRAAIHVDQLLGGQEVVVKSIGPQLARVSGVTGAAVLTGGETVLILNPVQLVERAERPSAQPVVAPVIVEKAPAEPAPLGRPSEPTATRTSAAPSRQATVLVVDDSLTVRKITSRTLTREGYDVLVAKDGIDALEKMQTRAPHVIVTDIEMPRMDGFDLTRNVRADPRLKDLPVIMITSRTADKHRQHAAELGVTVFLGKPYEERELLENIAGVARVPA